MAILSDEDVVLIFVAMFAVPLNVPANTGANITPDALVVILETSYIFWLAPLAATIVSKYVPEVVADVVIVDADDAAELE
jgi:hypothetical protein